MRGRLDFPVVFEPVEVVQLVTSNDLDWFGAISDHRDLVVERHDSNFALVCPLRHVFNLSLDCCLQTLHTGNIGFIFFSCVEELIGAVTKLHQTLHLLTTVTLDIVFAFDGLRDAHRPRNVDAEDDRDVLVAAHLLILDLLSGFNQICYLVCLRNFLLINKDFIRRIAELASPHLRILTHDGLEDAFKVKDTAAFLADERITCGHNAGILQAGKRHLEDIRVCFNNVDFRFFDFVLATSCLEVCTLLLTIFRIREVQVSIEIVVVHLAGGMVSLLLIERFLLSFLCTS